MKRRVVEANGVQFLNSNTVRYLNCLPAYYHTYDEIWRILPIHWSEMGNVATVWVPVTAQFLLHEYRCHLVSPGFPRIVFSNVLICSSVGRVILE